MLPSENEISSDDRHGFVNLHVGRTSLYENQLFAGIFINMNCQLLLTEQRAHSGESRLANQLDLILGDDALFESA